MNKPKLCPICGTKLQIHGPEDWKPSFYDPDSGGDPYNATCDCGFYFSTWTYDYTEFFAALNRRAPLPDNKALTCDGCMYKLREGWNYEHCVRCARHWPDGYRRPPEKGE